LQAVLPALAAVSLNCGFTPGSYEFCALRSVSVTVPLAQSGSVDPAGSCPPPPLLTPLDVPPVSPVSPVPEVVEDVAPALPPLFELPSVEPVSPLPPAPPTDPPGRLLLSGPLAEGPGVIDDTGVWPLLPLAPLPLPAPLPELTAQKTNNASTAARHATTARRRQ
jgi:hypothetical protein